MSAKPALFSRPIPIALFVILALIIDQATKLAVDISLDFQVSYPLLPWLALFRTYNTGVAFSMFADASGWLIVATRLIVVAFVLWMWRRTEADRSWAHLGYALIIAGALGNLIDRFAYGHVIDFILFHTDTWSFAVFNIADSCITCGALAIAGDELFAGKRQKNPEH
jgi:signal peptidase II